MCCVVMFSSLAVVVSVFRRTFFTRCSIATLAAITAVTIA
jgi:hypothetical protein